MADAITGGGGRWCAGFTGMMSFMALALTLGRAIMAIRLVTGNGGPPLDFERPSGFTMV
jgi:hypothetical protein